MSLSLGSILVALLALTHVATPAEKQPSPPQTVADHLVAAKAYRETAASARRDAESHQTMIDRYLYHPSRRAGAYQDDVRWYLDHCRRFIEQSNALAATAIELARYHEKQAEKLRKARAR